MAPAVTLSAPGSPLFWPLRCEKTHLSKVGTASERAWLTIITGNGTDQASVAESPIALPPVFGNEECAWCNSVAQVRSAHTIDRSVPNAEPRCTLLGVGGIRRLDSVGGQSLRDAADRNYDSPRGLTKPK
jgi:hypothetical protein